jgi:hypothetical protein
LDGLCLLGNTKYKPLQTRDFEAPFALSKVLKVGHQQKVFICFEQVAAPHFCVVKIT